VNFHNSSNEEEGEEGPFKRILIGLDVSDQTDLVIQIAAYLVNAFKAEAQVVTVINVPTTSAGNEMDGTPANQQEIRLRDELISRLHHHFKEDMLRKIEVKVLHGDPAQRIAEYADYSDSNLIIVGSRGQGALKRAFLGSVSESIAGRSKRSVLIVK
jgi:nucleotide-binding universal stress UspA family protein